MTTTRRTLLLSALTLALATGYAHAKDPKEITLEHVFYQYQ